MYLVKVEKEGMSEIRFIKSDDPKFKDWQVSTHPSVFMWLKDARKLKKKLDATGQFSTVEVMKISKMPQR